MNIIKKVGITVIFIMLLGATTVSAATLQAGKWMKGNTKGETKMNYTYKMPDSGYIYYELELIGEYCYYKNEKKEMDDSYVIYTSMVVNYKNYVTKGKASSDGNTFRSDNYSFKKGTTIKVSVYDAEGWETPFRIRVVYKKLKNFESENNDAKSDADAIKNSGYILGLLMGSDTDWVKYKVPSTGKYRISCVATNDDIDHSMMTNCWIGSKLVDTHNFRSGDGSSVILNKKLSKGSVVYVKLFDGTKGTFYKVSVKKVS